MKKPILFCLTAVILIVSLTIAAFAVYGDLNRDRSVDAVDAVMLAQYLAGWSMDFTAEDKNNADVFYDGVINAADAVKMAQFLAGWDVKLGPKGEDVEVDADDLFGTTDGGETTTPGDSETTTPETTAPAPDTTTPVEPDDEPDDEPYWNYYRGVNVNGLEDPNNMSKLWSAPTLLTSNSTYTNIVSKGFDHVRIPVPFHLYYDSSTGAFGKYNNRDYMATVDTAIDLAIANGLGVMLDFHGWYEINPTNADDKAKFKACWQLVAERYKDYGPELMFELMNEPHYKASTSTLINFQMEVVEMIRATGGNNETRLILIAGPDSNQPWKLPEVNITLDDPNLVMVVHIYNPGEFTHQGQTWAGYEANKQVALTDAHMSTHKWNLNEVKKFIDRTGMRVVINEIGMNVALADPADTDLYVRTAAQFCDENNIPLTWWGYDSEAFALYQDDAGWSEQNNYWRTNVLDALFLR